MYNYLDTIIYFYKHEALLDDDYPYTPIVLSSSSVIPKYIICSFGLYCHSFILKKSKLRLSKPGLNVLGL